MDTSPRLATVGDDTPSTTVAVVIPLRPIKLSALETSVCAPDLGRGRKCVCLVTLGVSFLPSRLLVWV